VIRVGAGGAVVEDLGSKNGTWVRGARITSSAVLADGDELRIGTVPMRLRILKPMGSTETGGAGPRR